MEREGGVSCIRKSAWGTAATKCELCSPPAVASDVSAHMMDFIIFFLVFRTRLCL